MIAARQSWRFVRRERLTKGDTGPFDRPIAAAVIGDTRRNCRPIVTGISGIDQQKVNGRHSENNEHTYRFV
jgi:hypothetical protein